MNYFYTVFLAIGIYAQVEGTCMQYATKSDSISSQGLIASTDERAILIHDSTYPPLLHKLEYGPDYSLGVNMDRGGFGIRDDNTIYACLFDGTSGGGLDSAYAAQDFTDEMIRQLGNSHIPISEDSDQARRLVTELLVRSSLAKPSRPSMYGDATCIFVDIAPLSQKGLYMLNGGALGDSGIIHIDSTSKRAHLFETILKDDRTNTADTGGCLTRRGMIYRPDNICVLSTQVAAKDFVVLASDGLLDNLSRDEEDDVLSLIVNSPFFDTLSTLEFSQKPSAYELEEFLKPYEGDNSLTAKKIVIRLNNYLRMLTAKKKAAQDALLQEWEKAALAQDSYKLQELGRRFRQNEVSFAGKCDDCLLIAFEI